MEPKNGQDMNTSREQITTTLDEAEDLTLFADETFDTDDVDLFEFTGEEDSPLTRLKSIILSLDWEITDEILQELADELAELQKVWEGDKVARVYLQGLGKIGRYLRSEGAYAHPNAIKLLLTFYYNFEKIISSPDITGDTIAALLKSDVRKFKILQYQISQTAPAPEGDEESEAAAEAGYAVAPDSQDPLQLLKASILGLEWEVTDTGLEEFNQRVVGVEETCGDDRSAQVLIQGLKALGAYITEEKADAHPEAFTLLHSFYEGLESLLGNGELDSKQRQELLIDRVGRLNALKAAIAQAAAAASGSTADEVVDEILQPLEGGAPTPPTLEEEPTLEMDDETDLAGLDAAAPGAVAAMETAETPYPDDVLDPSAIQPVTDEIADDFIEEELSIGTEITPALAASDEEVGFDEELAAASLDTSPMDEIEEQLDLLFPDSETEEMGEEAAAGPGGEKEDEISFTDDEMFAGLDDILSEEDSQEDSGSVPAAAQEEEAGGEPPPALADADAEAPSPALADADGEEPPPALADAEEEGGFSEDATVADLDESPMEDLEKKLEFFFGESEPEEESAQEGPAALTDATEEEEGREEIVAPALADAPDEGGFNEELVAGAIDGDEALDIDSKLDSFFGESEPEEEFPEESGAELTDSLVEEEDQEETIAPALADAPDEGGFNEELVAGAIDGDEALDIDSKLDSFFGESEPEEEFPEESGAELTDSLVEEEDQEETIAPALADAPDEGGFNEEQETGGIVEETGVDIEAKLDAFFGEPAAGEAPVAETATGEETAPAPAAGLEAKLDTFFSNEEVGEAAETAGGEALAGAGLAALAGSLARLAEKPAEDTLAAVSTCLADLDREGLGPEQTVRLQLLDSALDMLSRLPQPPARESLDLLDHLAAGVQEDEQDAAALAESVARFTAWQRQTMEELLRGQPSPAKQKPPELALVSEEIRSAFTELRSSLAEELEALRREIREQQES